MPRLMPLLAIAMALCSNAVLAQERQWALDTADNDAFLVFGVAESDDVGISFWCTIGSDKLKVFVPEGSADLAPNITAPLVLKIGAASGAASTPIRAFAASGCLALAVTPPE